MIMEIAMIEKIIDADAPKGDSIIFYDLAYLFTVKKRTCGLQGLTSLAAQLTCLTARCVRYGVDLVSSATRPLGQV
jgi:hypothetical protein